MTLPELLALATSTLNSVPHHPAVTPELCAAICWVESSGRPDANGDDGKALGLAQFHLATWVRFRDACHPHAMAPARRTCPDCSMRALVRELSFAAERAARFKPNNAGFVRRFLCRFHNAGTYDDRNTVYCRKVAAAIDQLFQSEIRNPKSEIARAKNSARKISTTQPAEVAAR